MILLSLHYFVPNYSIIWNLSFALTIYGLIAPLIVSAFVYEFNNYHDLPWLNNLISEPYKILNVHAGFDETSKIIQNKFKSSEFSALNFYDAEKHTEVAIKPAMKITDSTIASHKIETENIKIPNNSAD